MTKPILYIDTDMGVDDIIAICMLIASNKFDIRGISVVNGVSSPSKGSANLCRILKFMKVSIPIYQGVNQATQGSDLQFPLIDRQRASRLILMQDIVLPKNKYKKLSLNKLISAITLENDKINFLCLGPLTNIKIILKHIKARNNISRLTIMGGAVNVRGNVFPEFISEYNFRLDPKAADYVLKSGLPITLVPIDATKCVPASMTSADPKLRPLLEKFYEKVSGIKIKSPVARIIKALILNNRRDFNNFYDPLAAAVLINPKIIAKIYQSRVRISLSKTSFAKVKKVSKGNSISIIEKINTEYFFKILILLILSKKI